MNLTIVTTIFPPDVGGPAIYTSEILDRLGKRGHRIKVATSSKVAQPSSNVYVLPKKRIMNVRFFGYFCTNFVLFLSVLRASKDSDVIYVQNPTFLGLISLWVSKLLRKPVVLKFVGDKPWEKAFGSGKTEKSLEDFLRFPEGGLYIKFLFRLQKFVLHRVKRIIVPSQFLKEVLVNYYQVDSGRVRIVHNSTDLPNYRNSHHRSSLLVEKSVIITVGRLAKHKKIDQIVRVIRELSEEYSDIELLIVGEGPEEDRLKRLSREIGVDNRVKFYGRASHEETIALLQGADICVLNSLYEGLPHTVIEALACRVPVIATNIRGTDEVVKDRETGLLVAPNNTEELKDRIAQLLRDEGLRKRLVENAYKSVEEKFTWKKNLDLLEKELEEVM